MKNKGLSDFRFFLVIIGLLLVVLTFWFSVKFESEQEFKIYKKECEEINFEGNEIIRHFACNVPFPPSNKDDFIWEGNSYQFDEDYYPLDEGGYDWGSHYKNFNEVCKTDCRYYNYGCGLVAIVEKVEPYNLSIGKKCEQIEVEEIEIGEWAMCKDCDRKPIVLENLSIEWLKENCECISIYKCNEGGSCSWSSKEIQKYCQTYKCGEYLVEVK